MADYAPGYVARNLKTGMQTTWDGTQWSNPVPIQATGGVTATVPEQQEAQKYLTGLQATANDRQTLAQQAQHALELSKQTGTGGIMALPVIGGPIAHVAEAFDDPLKEMESNAVAGAKLLKATGQRLSQQEQFRYQAAFPGPQTNPGAIQGQVSHFNNDNTYAQARAAFGNAWVKAHGGSSNGADTAFNDWAAKHFDSDNNYFAGGVPASGAPAATPTAQSADGQWSILGAEPQK